MEMCMAIDRIGAALPESAPASIVNKAGMFAFEHAVLAAEPLPSASADQPALRSDQAAQAQQLVWHLPEPAALACSWQALVRTYGEQRDMLHQRQAQERVPASIFVEEQYAREQVNQHGAPAAHEPEPWRFGIMLGPQQQLYLKVVADGDERRSARRRRARVALRLEMILPGLGRIVIQLEPLTAGAMLDIAAEPAALPALRAVLPRVAELADESGVALTQCRLDTSLPRLALWRQQPTRAQTATFTLPLYRLLSVLATFFIRLPDLPTAFSRQFP
jgi:hypothetical protein